MLRHASAVKGVAYSPDGARIATGSTDKTVKVWDAVTGRELLTLGHADAVGSVVYSPDGDRIAAASDRTVTIEPAIDIQRFTEWSFTYTFGRSGSTPPARAPAPPAGIRGTIPPGSRSCQAPSQLVASGPRLSDLTHAFCGMRQKWTPNEARLAPCDPAVDMPPPGGCGGEIPGRVRSSAWW